MRIVTVHYRHHVSGGPERYLFDVTRELEARGHEVVPFSVRYAKNVPTEWSRYFVPPPGDPNAVYFRDVGGAAAKARFFARSVYSPAARRHLDRLLADVKPDLVYVIIVANGLSPSVLLACRDARVPVVMRLSDFHLAAPCYTCFDGEAACDLCLRGSKLHAVRKRCLQGSRVVSLARVAGMKVHEHLGLYDLVDRFVAPSAFLRERMIETGIQPARIVHIPTFVTPPDAPVGIPAPGEGVLYVGRLSAEKGVARLLDAWAKLGVPSTLRIVGSTATPEAKRLVALAAARNLDGVSFLGARPREEVLELMRRARVIAVPSICYENLPIALIEAMVSSKPVVAHRIGSLSEVIEDGVTGFLCDADAPREMAARLRELLLDPERASTMGRSARRVAESRFGAEEHVAHLLELFHSLTARTAGAAAAARVPTTGERVA